MPAIKRCLRGVGGFLIGPLLTSVLIALMAGEGPMLQMLGYGPRRSVRTSSPPSHAGEDRGEGSSSTASANRQISAASSVIEKLNIGAQAQAAPPPPGGECEPPDCIPLPSPITVARTLSHYAADSLQNDGGTLTITYHVFNSRDEEVGEILLVTTLASGVNYAPGSTTPQPDEPTPPDGRLAFVLPSIPAFGQISMTLTVDVPSGTTTIDDGARVFGNIRTRAVKASVDATTLPATLGVSEDYLRSTIDANTSDRYVLETIGRIGCDPTDLFEFVRDDIGYEAYRGSLRGARGTLWSKAGNALDQSSLLIAMLRACGIPARYVSGTLNSARAQDLVLSMFPPITRAVGSVPDTETIADPAASPTLLAEAQEHFWVEYYEGGNFIPVDPTFRASAVGLTFATASSSFSAIDPALRHSVRLRLTAESTSTGLGASFLGLADALGAGMQLPMANPRIKPLGGQLATETDVLDEMLATVELTGEPLSLGHFVHREVNQVFTANTYSPWLQIGDRADLIRGADYQELFGALGGNAVTGLLLQIETSDPQGKRRASERWLVDRVGAAIRANAQPGLSISFSASSPIVEPHDVTTIAIGAGHEAAVGLGQDAERLRSVTAELSALEPLLVQSTNASPAEFPLASEALLKTSAASRLVTRLMTRSFLAFSDVTDRQVERGMLTRLYYTTPRIIISSARPGPEHPSIDLDLRVDEVRAIPYPGQNNSAAIVSRTVKGLIDGGLEDQIISQAVGAPSLSTISAIASGAAGPLTVVGPDFADDLEQLEVSENARAEIRAAVSNGRIVLASAQPVDGRAVWLDYDPVSGQTVPVVEGGGHQAILEYITVFLLATPIGVGAGLIVGRLVGWSTAVLAGLSAILGDPSASDPTSAATAKAQEALDKVRSATGRACLGLFGPFIDQAPLPCLPMNASIDPTLIWLQIQTTIPQRAFAGGIISGFCCSFRFGGFPSGQAAGLDFLRRTVDPELPTILSDPHLGPGLRPARVQRLLSANADLADGQVSLVTNGTFARVSGELTAFASANVEATLASYPKSVPQGMGLGGSPRSVISSGNYLASTGAVTLHSGSFSVNALTGSATVGGTSPTIPFGLHASECSGEVSIADQGNFDAVTDDSNCSRVLVLSADPDQTTVPLDGAATVALTVSSNINDLYNVKVELPAGWSAQISSGSVVSITPADGQPNGTFEVCFTARSVSDPEIAAGTCTLLAVQSVSVPTVEVDVVPDSTFSTPHEHTLVKSAYRIEMRNLSAVSDEFAVSIAGLPQSDFTVAVDAVSIAPREVGIVGLAVHPASGLLSPGTIVSFSVTATGQNTGVTATEFVSFSYPEVFGVELAFSSVGIAATPGSTLQTTLAIVPAANVDESFPLSVESFDGIGVAGLPAALTLLSDGTCPQTVPSGLCNVPVSLHIPPGTLVGTTLFLTIMADLCNGVAAESCTIPQPSQRFATLAVFVGSPQAICILAGAGTAMALHLDDFAQALEDMGHAFARLSVNRMDVFLQERALSTGNLLVALLREYGRAALADGIETVLSGIATGDDVQIEAALTNVCAVLTSLNDELTAIADEQQHGFRISLAPAAHSVAVNEPAEFAVRLVSIGTLESTINLSVSGVPPGVIAQLSQSAVVLQPNLVLNESSGTPVTVTLTSTTPIVGSIPFSVNAQVAEAPTVVGSAHGLLRSSAVDVVAVRPVPQVVNPAGTPVVVSAQLLNTANVSRSVAVALRVEDSNGTTVFTGTPKIIALATGGALTTVDLGSVDTTGFADDTFTAIVTAQNADGTPLPGRQGRGSFIIGLPVVASASVEPAIVPPGSVERVVSKVRVQARSSAPRGTGFHDQSAKAVAASSSTATPEEALGYADDRLAMVSPGGSLLLDMGAGLDRIADGPGVDLVVFERSPLASSDPIDRNGCYQASGYAYQVDVSEDLDGPFVPVGNPPAGPRETGDEFDLNSVGLLSARYVRITPTSGPISIDAVLAAHTHHPGGIVMNHLVPIGADEGIAHPPAVADIDGDGTPDIIVVAQIGFTQCDVLAIDGRTGAEKWRYPLPFGHAGVIAACGNLNSPAIADTDGDTVPEIVINRFASGVFGAGGPLNYVFKNDGTLLHEFPHNPSAGFGYSPSLENLHGDARPEIVISSAYLESDGTLRTRAFDQSVVLDVNGDNTQELVGGLAIEAQINALRPDGSAVWSTSLPGTIISKFSVADLDRDGSPELVASFQENDNDRGIRVVEHDGTLGWRHDFPRIAGNCSITGSQSCQVHADCPAGETCNFPGGLISHISRPSIADLNNDGRPELAIVVNNLGGDHRDYVVALDADGNELWRTEARDPHGAAGDVSTADLDGDGAAEVLWNGYCAGFTIFDGTTGKVLYRDPRVHSVSAFDYPISADADADGHLDVITGDADGLYVFSDTSGWRAGRSIWNQRDYRVTNIDDDLTVPTVQPDSWEWHNTYLSQSVIIDDPAQATVTVDHEIAAGVTIDGGAIDPASTSITGQTIHWAPPPFALSMGDTFSAGVDLPALSPGQSHVVSESTTVSATLNFLSGQTGSTLLTLDPVTVYAPHIIAVEPALQVAAPGSTAVFSVRLQNLRSLPETFTLSVVGVDPASVTLPAPILIAADSEALVPVSIAVSPSGHADSIAFGVLANGNQGTLDEAGGQIDVRGALASGLHVEVVPVSDTAGQGTNALFRVIVTNTGNSTQNVLLSAVLPPGVSASFERALFSVPPGLTGSRETVVSLAITPGTTAGPAVFSITATSTSDPDLTATAQGTLSVRASGVAVDLRPDTLLVSPVQGAVVNAIVTNLGSPADIPPFGPMAFNDFCDVSSLTLNGSAAMLTPNVDCALRLTNGANQAGTAFTTQPVSLADDGSFSTFFCFQISNPGGVADSDGLGGDGLVFTLQTNANSAVGGIGGGIGYGGLFPSLGVEIDTFQGAPDANGNHVGINLQGSVTSLATANIPGRLNDGEVFCGWVDYDGATNNLEVRGSNTMARPIEPLLSYTVDLPAVLGGTDAFVGFTSGTAGATNVHDILSWHFVGELAPIASSGVDRFTLSLAGPIASFATLASDSVLLQPGASISVPITIDNLEAFLLQRTFLMVQATSTTDPLVHDVDAAAVDVGAFRAVSAAFESGSTATGCSVSTDLALLITNAGNAGDERYTITFDSVPAGVTLTPATTQFLVPPLKTARIPITVSPPGSGTFDITATVSTLGDPLCIVPPCASLPGATTNAAVELTTVVDGTSCSDANACTHTDTCVNGACVGSPVDCSQTDECHDAGICDPLSGCPNASADGTVCDDGSVCTSGDTCQAGACVGGSTTTCGPCGTCDPILGTCSGVCTPTPTSAGTATPTATSTPIPTPPLDHFECHRAKVNSGEPPFVTVTALNLADRFGALTVDARGPVRLCNPTDKNGEDPTAPAHLEHLTAYKIRRAVGAARFAKVTNQVVADQFGSLTVDVIKPRQLLVPSMKSLTGAPPPLTDSSVDHFTCYKMRIAKGAPAFAPVLGVSIEDQFGPTTVDVIKPVALCAPTDKAGEDPSAPAHPGFLTCYKVKRVAGSPRFSPLAPVYINNQFGPAALKVSKTKDLCLPSLLNPAPTGTPTATSAIPTNTRTVTLTGTPTTTADPNASPTATGTPFPTRTRTPSATPSRTGTPTRTRTWTPSSTDVLDTIVIGGPSVTVNIDQPGRKARLVFGGDAGQRISLTESGIAGTIAIFNPDGTTLVGSASTSFVDVQTLSATGLHTILFIPNGAGTGNATFRLYDVAEDVTGSLVINGEPFTIRLAVPGRNARVTFDATAGQFVGLDWFNGTMPGPLGIGHGCCADILKIKNPDGTDFYTADYNGHFRFVGPMQLPQTGTYAITLDPVGALTGDLTVAVHSAVDLAGSIQTDGTPVQINITTPGQNARLGFAGVAGDRVYLQNLQSSFGVGVGGRLRIINPDGVQLIEVDFGSVHEFFLTQSGTHQLVIDPAASETGGIILAIHTSVDVVGPITPGDPPLTVTTMTPGQQARLTFAAVFGQSITMNFANSTMGFTDVRILDPDGDIVDRNNSGIPTYTLSATLTESGTYTITINPSDSNFGSADVSVAILSCPPLMLDASPNTVAVAGSVTATWGDVCVPTNRDWIAFYAAGAPDSAFLSFVYTTGTASGSVPFPIPCVTPGTYELRIHPDDRVGALATSNPLTVTAAAPTLDATPATVSAGGNVTATWSGICGPTSQDWIGLYTPGAPNTSYLKYEYLNGQSSGSMAFSIPSNTAPGTYELRLFPNDLYTLLATSEPLTVSAP